MLKVATKGEGARQTGSRFGDGGVPILPFEPSASARTQITLTRFPRNKLGHVIRCHSQPQPELLSRPSSSSISKSEYRWLNLVRSREKIILLLPGLSQHARSRLRGRLPFAIAWVLRAKNRPLKQPDVRIRFTFLRRRPAPVL